MIRAVLAGFMIATASLFVAAPAFATLVQATSSALLAAEVQMDWSAFGPTRSVIHSPAQATVGGVTAAIDSTSGNLFVFQQGHQFRGDFAPGTSVLLQVFITDHLTISFSTPVWGVGFNVDPVTFRGNYEMVMFAYSADGVLIGSVAVDGTASGSNSGTAPFIGGRAYVLPISTIQIGFLGSDDPLLDAKPLDPQSLRGDVALGAISLATKIPEPASAIIVMSGMTLIGLSRWRRLRTRLNATV